MDPTMTDRAMKLAMRVVLAAVSLVSLCAPAVAADVDFFVIPPNIVVFQGGKSPHCLMIQNQADRSIFSITEYARRMIDIDFWPPRNTLAADGEKTLQIELDGRQVHAGSVTFDARGAAVRGVSSDLVAALFKAHQVSIRIGRYVWQMNTTSIAAVGDALSRCMSVHGLASAVVDPVTVGTWLLPAYGGLWIWKIAPDGHYSFSTEGDPSHQPHSGTVTLEDGHWSLRATNGYSDEGSYTYDAPDTLVVTDKLGTGHWLRAPK
jgi:hypothetical protein